MKLFLVWRLPKGLQIESGPLNATSLNPTILNTDLTSLSFSGLDPSGLPMPMATASSQHPSDPGPSTHAMVTHSQDGTWRPRIFLVHNMHSLSIL